MFGIVPALKVFKNRLAYSDKDIMNVMGLTVAGDRLKRYLRLIVDDEGIDGLKMMDVIFSDGNIAIVTNKNLKNKVLVTEEGCIDAKIHRDGTLTYRYNDERYICIPRVNKDGYVCRSDIEDNLYNSFINMMDNKNINLTEIPYSKFGQIILNIIHGKKVNDILDENGKVKFENITLYNLDDTLTASEIFFGKYGDTVNWDNNSYAVATIDDRAIVTYRILDKSSDKYLYFTKYLAKDDYVAVYDEFEKRICILRDYKVAGTDVRVNIAMLKSKVGDEDIDIYSMHVMCLFINRVGGINSMHTVTQIYKLVDAHINEITSIEETVRKLVNEFYRDGYLILPDYMLRFGTKKMDKNSLAFVPINTDKIPKGYDYIIQVDDIESYVYTNAYKYTISDNGMDMKIII